MKRARHALWLLGEVLQYGAASKRFGLVFAVLIGLVLALVAITAQVAAPFVLYPFA